MLVSNRSVYSRESSGPNDSGEPNDPVCSSESEDPAGSGTIDDSDGADSQSIRID